MSRKLPWPEIIVTAFVILVGAGVYLYAHKDEGALEESKRRGEALVAALHAYEREHATYPERLDDLAPQYIGSIDPPTWGLRRWRYRTYEPSASGVEADSPGIGGIATAQDTVGPRDVPASQDSAVERVYFQLSVAADESGYPVLYYDLAAQRWVLNN